MSLRRLIISDNRLKNNVPIWITTPCCGERSYYQITIMGAEFGYRILVYKNVYACSNCERLSYTERQDYN